MDEINPQQTKLALLIAVSEYCNREIYVESGIADYRIRSKKFVEQDWGGRVILTIVVLVTLAGIVMAGAQLWISYKLATAGKSDFSSESNFAIERGKISLKSSITGLFILMFSFFFFWVYVIRIYPLEEVEVKKDANASSAAANPPSPNSYSGQIGAVDPAPPQLATSSVGVGKAP